MFTEAKIYNCKKEKLFEHVKLRLKERYNLDLTPELHDKMIEEINNRKSKGFKRTCRIYFQRFNLNKQRFYVIFDIKRQVIATFLTKEMFVRSTNQKKRKTK